MKQTESCRFETGFDAESRDWMDKTVKIDRFSPKSDDTGRKGYLVTPMPHERRFVAQSYVESGTIDLHGHLR